MNEENINIQDIIDALKTRWQLIVAITLIATIISAAASFFLIKPKYEASTKLFIGKEESDKESYNNNDVQMYQKLLKTYSDVIMTKDLVGNAIDDDGINIKAEQALANLTVTPKTDTQILQISYKGEDREQARDIVQAVTDEFVKVSTDLISNANVKVVESVTLPEEPVSPNKKLNIAIAFVLGAMVGVGLSLLLEFMDNTFKDKDQVENILGVPVIGNIPNTDSKK